MDGINRFVSQKELKPIFRMDKDTMTKLQRNRRVWAIRDLLDKPLRQKDILDLWRHRGRTQYEQYKKLVEAGWSFAVDVPDGRRDATVDDIKIWKPKEFKKGIGISKGDMSKIINGDEKRGYVGLIEEKIVEIAIVENEKGYCLVEGIETLYKILTEFSNPRLPKEFITEVRKDLMHSEYAKSLINLDLVNKIQFFNDEPLNEDEMNFILILIKISPSALLRFLKEVHKLRPAHIIKPYGEKILLDPENEKQNLLMDLQFLAFNDISNLLPYEEKMQFAPPCPVNIQFEIKTSLKTEEGEYQHTSRLQRSSFKLLSETEQEEAMKENNEIMELLSSLPNIKGKIPDLFEEKVDKSFSLESSPLQYEKNN